MRNQLCICLLCLVLSACQNKSKLTDVINYSVSLHSNWEFRQLGSDKWHPATVPGVVHTDLLKNGLIDDPYWENNELKQHWIENEDWTYRTEFNISANQLANEEIEIDFKGLDTYAKVYLNGQKIISADNMFRSWQTNVKKYLVIGENHLEIHFDSPLKVNKDKVENSAYQLPSGCETGDLQVGSYTRKAAYHFGWDWGPRFVTVGIWRPVNLNFWNRARITNINCQTIHLGENTATIIKEVRIESSAKAEYELSVDGEAQSISLKQGMNFFTDTVVVETPKLWWTNGLGEPHLYDLVAKIEVKGQVVDSASIKYGIRTIELVNEPDSIGTSFYFKLNGQPVFMKGANYIPQDLFLPTVTEARYQKLIAQVKAANMNMLRVWGGGIYENDIFYDLCDANGILVWQDFMFAGSLYPVESKFKENVKAEVIENIERLRHHPCIAVWCGNNEIEVAWQNWGWQKQYNYSQADSIEIWNNYKSIFHELIPSVLEELHAQGSYTSTSPLSNWGTAENFNHSSMHYWGVWHGKADFAAFDDNVGRFMVEYGFQSFPSLSTLKTVAHDSSLYLGSEVMTNRQKSYIGNGMISKQISKYFDAPFTFSDFVELSQQTQAIAYKNAISAHIKRQPHCMGTLFWQLNDCWPGPSWSVIEYNGTEKEAYKVVKSLFEQ